MTPQEIMTLYGYATAIDKRLADNPLTPEEALIWHGFIGHIPFEESMNLLRVIYNGDNMLTRLRPDMILKAWDEYRDNNRELVRRAYHLLPKTRIPQGGFTDPDEAEDWAEAVRRYNHTLDRLPPGIALQAHLEPISPRQALEGTPWAKQPLTGDHSPAGVHGRKTPTPVHPAVAQHLTSQTVEPLDY